jgi:hypothetical protein
MLVEEVEEEVARNRVRTTSVASQQPSLTYKLIAAADSAFTPEHQDHLNAVQLQMIKIMYMKLIGFHVQANFTK